MLKRVIITEWNTISSEETSKLVQSMPKRLTEVLRSECLHQMYKKEKSLEKEKKTSSKSSRKRTKKSQKNSANSSTATAKSASKFTREYRAMKRTLQNTLLMPSLRHGNAIRDSSNDSTY
ncbi:hypothetical protein TNCV_650941 [Trichonephila clavipes]|nr:hypothetical protein TNCV_650941 [Trichonephila clavipes]